MTSAPHVKKEARPTPIRTMSRLEPAAAPRRLAIHPTARQRAPLHPRTRAPPMQQLHNPLSPVQANRLMPPPSPTTPPLPSISFPPPRTNKLDPFMTRTLHSMKHSPLMGSGLHGMLPRSPLTGPIEGGYLPSFKLNSPNLHTLLSELDEEFFAGGFL